MDYSTALRDAQQHDEQGEFVGLVSMKHWTRWLPQWAFEKSLDFSLRGLRADMVQEYKQQTPWRAPC